MSRLLQRLCPVVCLTSAAVSVLGTSPKATTTVNIELPESAAQVNPLVMGCHSDSGFAMEPFGFESNMIVGASFGVNRSAFVPLDTGDTGQPINTTWNTFHSGRASFGLDATDPFHGQASMKLELALGGSYAAVSNRGMGNEGLVLHAGKPYTGYVFAKTDAKPVTVTVALHDISDRAAAPTVLASAEIHVTSTSWVQYNFSLQPNGSTSCVYIPFGSDPDVRCMAGKQDALQVVPGHACQRCGGEIAFALTTPGSEVVRRLQLKTNSGPCVQ
jgi:hypothetical protein